MVLANGELFLAFGLGGGHFYGDAYNHNNPTTANFRFDYMGRLTQHIFKPLAIGIVGVKPLIFTLRDCYRCFARVTRLIYNKKEINL